MPRLSTSGGAPSGPTSVRSWPFMVQTVGWDRLQTQRPCANFLSYNGGWICRCGWQLYQHIEFKS